MIKKIFFIIFFFTMFNNSFASTKFDIIENFRKIDNLSFTKKKISLEDGMSIIFHLSGGIERDLFVKVDGRASVVDHLKAATCVINADSRTFVMLACGRIDPQAEIDAGRISWTGDNEWGERVAKNLRFTM